MTAETEQLLYIASLEKELAESAEALKQKRKAREECGLRPITDLREEQVRLRHQLLRVQARQDLAARLQALTEQIEAKKREQSVLVHKMMKGDDDSACTSSAAEDDSGNKSLDRYLDDGQLDDSSSSYFSIPETRSTYEGFAFRDDDMRSRGSGSRQTSTSRGGSAAVASTGSSSGAVSSYCLPLSYSPAKRSSKSQNQAKQLQQQPEHQKQQSDSTSSTTTISSQVPSISSTFSPPLLWKPSMASLASYPSKNSRKSSVLQSQEQQTHSGSVCTSTGAQSTFSFLPPLPWQPSASSLAGSWNKYPAGGNSSVAASFTTLSSFSSTFSPPLVWEHSSRSGASPAPKSPGDLLRCDHHNKQQPPSMLDTVLRRHQKK